MKTRAFATATIAALAAALAIPASAQQRVDDASLTAAASIRAPEAWAAGHTGDGVGIALVDTGVSPRPDLHDGVTGQVLVGARERLTDGHGHGTFLAGLIVGDDGPAGRLGVAPDANVVSFKAADARGETTLERVVATLGTVRLMADELGLRVVVLALGGPTDDIPDPIEQALEQLWADGLVVVVASGNDGDVVTEPGVSPYLLTAGATNDHGTADRTDDVVPGWSGRGQGRDGHPKPDVHAPGTSVVSARVPGSLADRENPSSRIGGRWFRGSGTSMAAAITAGAAALVLDADPDATPDEVKGRLIESARPTQANPAGTIDVPAAVASTAVANGHLPPIEPSDEPAVPDQSSSLPISAQFGWNGSSWIGSSWIGSSWIGSSWIELEWDGSSWIGSSWIDQEWEGSSWIGSSWIGSSWIGSSWVDDNWVGVSWTSTDDESVR